MKNWADSHVLYRTTESPSGLGAHPAVHPAPPPIARAKSHHLLAAWQEDVACVFGRDPAARTRFEVLTTYPGVHAILIHRLSHRLWCRGFCYAARLLSFLSRLWTNIDIHPGATIGRRFFIDHGAGVVIGETAHIGDDVTLYHGVTLGGTTWSKGRRHPTLGNGVLVGAGAKILGPITLGHNVRVGANSVVVKSVPPNRTVVGIPGKVVQSKEGIAMNPGGIDLDHDRIPDVVSQTIVSMMERIEALENRLHAMRSTEADRLPPHYDAMAVSDTCCPNARPDATPASFS